MPVTKTVSNKLKLELGKGTVNFAGHAFKVVLMAEGFVFDKDAHGDLEDVEDDIITDAGGYTEKSLVIDDAWNQDNVNDLAFLNWKNVTWSAVGGDFDDFDAAIVYDDDHADDLIVGCIDFGETISLVDESGFRLQDTGFEIVGGN